MAQRWLIAVNSCQIENPIFLKKLEYIFHKNPFALSALSVQVLPALFTSIFIISLYVPCGDGL
jgi:hypothetical protein